MNIRWGVLSARTSKALKAGWLITAALIAFYVGMVEPRNRHRGIAMERRSGLAAVAGQVGWEPISLWRQASILPYFSNEGSIQKDVVHYASLTANVGGGGGSGEDSDNRRVVRSATMSLVVQSPARTSEKVIQLAEAAGGFLVSSQINGGADAIIASLAIRVPAAKFEEVRTQMRKLGLRVESESLESQDVTKQYVDQEARLHNLRAQEQQYLGILRKAATVKDTLEVSDKLNEVRGAIEEKQAEFEALSKQVETVGINITLRAESDAQVFGLHWRPLYQLKIAAREGVEGLGNYVSSMTALLFYVPTILLWLFTILAGAAIGWRILRWGARVFFGFSPKAVRGQQG